MTTTTRPEVVAILLAQDPARPLMHADGTALTLEETDLALGATPAERVAAAEAVLLARFQADQHLRAVLIQHMVAAGISITHGRRAVDVVQLPLDQVPHTELAKLTGADDAGMVAADVQRLLGPDWTAALARETGLRRTEIADILASRAVGDATGDGSPARVSEPLPPAAP